MCPASDAATMCRRPVWEFAERAEFSEALLGARVHNLVFPIPCLTTVAPYSPFDPLASPAVVKLARHSRSSIRSASCLNAQTMRDILLASATVISMGGSRYTMFMSHELEEPLHFSHRTAALAPMVSNLRNVRSPIGEISPAAFPQLSAAAVLDRAKLQSRGPS